MLCLLLYFLLGLLLCLHVVSFDVSRCCVFIVSFLYLLLFPLVNVGRNAMCVIGTCEDIWQHDMAYS